MIGTVDELGRAIVSLAIRAELNSLPTHIDAWIDTAFNGELVIPRRIIDAAKLEQTAGIEAKLADGSNVMLEAFSCVLDWFGADRRVAVIANDGKHPLLGIGLLVGRRLVIDYARLTVLIEPVTAGA